MSAIDFLLFEQAAGYSVWEVIQQPDTIGGRLQEVQDAANDLSRFGKMVKLASFVPFSGAAQALENANEISEGICSEQLRSTLEINLPKSSKKRKVVLGISDRNLAASIKQYFPNIECEANEAVQDLLRGIRLHGHKMLKQLREGDMERAQLGLGHAYSRAKVKFSVQKNDNHIIQAIAIIDQLDKDINTFAMRVREWYSWHYPELYKIVSDNQKYSQLVLLIQDKSTLDENQLHEVAKLVDDDAATAQAVIDAAKTSMGTEISKADLENISNFAERVVSLGEFRKSMHAYLVNKMSTVAPNLAQLIGEFVGARLISHAGSLTNLSKYPASTVQILGAEKALFRALKTKGNTPKYGLIYHSSFIGRASTKNKGRISRFLANKCSIASRIDCFSDVPTTKFGEILRNQVEDRLTFYAEGKAPEKNSSAMKRAMDAALAELKVDMDEDGENSDVEMEEDKTEAPIEKKGKKDKKERKDEKKKEKKSKKREAEVELEGEPEKKKEKRDKKEKKRSKKEKA